MSEPKHRAVRNSRRVTHAGDPVEYLTPDGKVAYSGPICSVTDTHEEMYCGTCRKWVECKGIMGAIRFMAVHDSTNATHNEAEIPQ